MSHLVIPRSHGCVWVFALIGQYTQVHMYRDHWQCISQRGVQFMALFTIPNFLFLHVVIYVYPMIKDKGDNSHNPMPGCSYVHTKY